MKMKRLTGKCATLMCAAAAMLSTGGCSQKNSGETDGVKNTEFPTEGAASTESVPVDIVMRITDWYAAGDTLVCQSDGTDYSFFTFSLDNFSDIDSLGRTGMGPDEFVHPILVTSRQSDFITVADAGKNRLFRVGEGGAVTAGEELPPMMPLNDLGYLSDGAIAGMDLTPQAITWQAIDLKADSLRVIERFPASEGMESLNLYFKWDADGGKCVLAMQDFDKLMIADVTADGLVENGRWFIGEGYDPANPTHHYVDVKCGEKYFYLLSWAEYDSEKNDSFPCVEIYTYDCTPVAKITLDIPAWSMALDSKRHRLIFISNDDDDLHTLTLARGEY